MRFWGAVYQQQLISESNKETFSSVLDEISELRWPVLWRIFLGVVPPFLFGPPVVFACSWSEVPSKGFTTGEDDPIAERKPNIATHNATILRSSNDKGNEDPQSKDP